MKTLTFPSPRGCISYIVYDEESAIAVLIDPSLEVGATTYLEALNGLHASLAYVIETHTHADHISIARTIAKETGAGIVRHKNAPATHSDIRIGDRETLIIGEASIDVFSSPGHTDDSICIYTGSDLFTGDTLLVDGTGRTDFQNGDSRELYHSLHYRIGRLPPETIIRPGHNYKNIYRSTLRKELNENPRMNMCEPEFVEFMDSHHPPLPELFESAIRENSL